MLCVQSRANEVRTAIAECGSPIPSEIGPERGVPENWIAFDDVVPSRPVQPRGDADILDCLRPLPGAELSFEGGIRLEGFTWLAGFPPQIRLLGDAESVGTVFIDQQEALRGVDDEFTAPGWDAAGAHLVATSAGSRTYTIEDAPQSWKPWGAGDAEAVQDVLGLRRKSICGALVLEPSSAELGRNAVVVPSTNKVLIGAVPGQVEVCEIQSGLPPSAPCLGFPSFEPVWALPATPLRCDKRSTQVIRLPLANSSRPMPGLIVARGRRLSSAQVNVRSWCAAILDASRKGLAVSPPNSDATALWKAYRDQARSLMRSMR